MEQVAVAWSTGKDASLALHDVAADPAFEVVELFTVVRTDTDSVRGHDVPRALLERQAEALGYPLRIVALSDEPDAYERHLTAAFDAYARRGIDRVVYADLFVESIREYRESLLADYDVEGYWPLWDRGSETAIDDFLDAGFEATVVRVDADELDASFVCRDLDDAFLTDFPSEADPCGENGEFHTFVTDGPVFDEAVAVEVTGRTTRSVERGAHGGTYHYCDLQSPGAGPGSEPGPGPSP